MNGADTAFVLISAALVMLMTPGLAFFYGGMVRVKSALNMLMMSLISMGIVAILWVLYGYSLTFGGDIGGGLLGNFDHIGLKGIDPTTLTGGDEGIPVIAFALFQLMFATLTPALMSGALADRVKFSAWALFIALWVTVVYFPVAHWVWQEDGWLYQLDVIDFAGGTAVHINAGVGALAAVLVVGKRIGFKKDPMRPHNLPLVVLGAALLWFGWFGFNAGSALAADGTAANMAFNTQVATGAAMLGWLIYERIRHGAFTTLGAASGAIGKPRRHHPLRRPRQRLRRHPHRPRRRRPLLLGRQPQVQARLRRLAGRRRRPPGRRCHRHPARRRPRRRRRRRPRPARQAGHRRLRHHGLLLRRLLAARQVRRRDDRLPGPRGGRGRRRRPGLPRGERLRLHRRRGLPDQR